MNFLIITFDFPPHVGGIETRAKNYIKNLTKLNNNVTVIALTPISKAYVERRFEATVYRYPSSPLFVFRVFITAVKVTNERLIDAMHILTGANTLFGLLSLIWGEIKGIKTGIFLYGKDILSSKRNPLQLLFLQLALLFTNKIGVNSKATSKLLPKWVIHKIHILYPGVNTQVLRRYQSKYAVSQKGREILFVGRLVKRKGVDDLLHAFKLVLEKIPQAKLTIVGDGPERDALCDLAGRLQIRERVEFTGMLMGRELYNKYQECDVFVMPSKRIGYDVEGFGMVFLEAAFFKKPSVGTWSGGIPEAVVHGQTGVLVPEGDIHALENAIELLLTNKALAQKLGWNANRRITKEFTWEKATLKLLKMYH